MMEYPFPLAFYQDLVNLIAYYKDVFEVITYQDLEWLDDTDKENFYPKEREHWLKYRDPNKIYLIIQHDLDSGTPDAIEMLNSERDTHLKSVLMVLIDPINSALVSDCHKFSTYTCPIDIAYLKELETKYSFEIGYHGNAYERSHFNADLAKEIFRADLKFLRQHFSIQSYCPHGGPIDFNGRSNGVIEFPEEENNRLKWVLIDYRFQYDDIYSDGGHYLISDPENHDIREFIMKMKPGGRYLLHIHPCYYSSNATPSKNFSGTPWYDELFQIYQDQQNPDQTSTSKEYWANVSQHIEEHYVTRSK